jgi:hypothetical protein
MGEQVGVEVVGVQDHDRVRGGAEEGSGAAGEDGREEQQESQPGSE